MSDREIMNAKGLGEKYDPDKTKERLQEVMAEMSGVYPDAKKHKIVSFIKSAIRIVGYILIPINLLSAAVVLVLSEVVGIIEELV